MKFSIIVILIMSITFCAITAYAQETPKASPTVGKLPDVPTPVKLDDKDAKHISPVGSPGNILPANAVSVQSTVDQSPKSEIPKIIPPDRSPTIYPSRPEIIKPKHD